MMEDIPSRYFDKQDKPLKAITSNRLTHDFNRLTVVKAEGRFLWHGQLLLSINTISTFVRIHVIKARYLQVPFNEEDFSTHIEVRITSRRSPSLSYPRLVSKSVSNSTTPVFDETFSLDISSMPKDCWAHLDVYVTKRRSNEKRTSFLGGMSLNLRRLEREIEGNRGLSTNQWCVRRSSQSIQTSGGFPDLLSKVNSKSSICVTDSRKRVDKSGGSTSYRSGMNQEEDVLQSNTLTSSWYFLTSERASFNNHSNTLGIRNKETSPLYFHSSDNTDQDGSRKSHCLDNYSSSDSSLPSDLDMLEETDRRNLVQRFLVPHSSEKGYGFTLISRSERRRFTDLRASQPDAVNCIESYLTRQGNDLADYTKRDETRLNICIQNVLQDTPADMVNLPIGAYLVEVNRSLLDPKMSLKQVVARLREAASTRKDRAVQLGLVIPDHLEQWIQCSRLLNAQMINEHQDTSLSHGHRPHERSCGSDVSNRNEDMISWVSIHSGSSTSRSYSSFTSKTRRSRRFSKSRQPDTTTEVYCHSDSVAVGSGGPVLLCEERCIDDNNEISQQSLVIQSSGGSKADPGTISSSQKRYLTLAHPVLKLHWSEVLPREANRQWAISKLIKNVENISAEFFTGVHVYYVGLKKRMLTEAAELRFIFLNITEISSHVGRLLHRLRAACLSYLTDPSDDREMLASSSQSKVSINTVSEQSRETERSGLFAKLRKNLITRPLLSSRISTKSTASIAGSSRTGVRSGSEHLAAPPHGHLDKPGLVINDSLATLTVQYHIYVDAYVERMRRSQDLCSRYPAVKSYCSAQKLATGVPTLQSFLNLPIKFLRTLLIDLERVVKWTNHKHGDWSSLEACLQCLRNAVHFRLPTSNGLFREQMLSRSRSYTLSSPDAFDPVTLPRSDTLSSKFTGDSYFQKLSEQLDKYIITSHGDSSFSSMSAFFRHVNRFLIFSGPLWCTIKSVDSRAVADSELMNTRSQKVFAYLFDDCLLFVAGSEDLLQVPSSPMRIKRSLFCEPVLLCRIKQLSYTGGEPWIRFTMENNSCILLSCDNLEEQVVWKRLLKQRVRLANDKSTNDIQLVD